MRIDELKKIATENNYELRSDLCQHSLKRKGWDDYINISAKIKNHIWVSIVTICDEKDFNMIKAAVEFAETPLEDREEEKKFRLKYRWVTHSVWFLYLYRDEDGRMGVSKFTEDIEDRELGRIQVKFTLNEIEEIKEKFDTDLTDFELVEVEE